MTAWGARWTWRNDGSHIDYITFISYIKKCTTTCNNILLLLCRPGESSRCYGREISHGAIKSGSSCPQGGLWGPFSQLLFGQNHIVYLATNGLGIKQDICIEMSLANWDFQFTDKTRREEQECLTFSINWEMILLQCMNWSWEKIESFDISIFFCFVQQRDRKHALVNSAAENKFGLNLMSITNYWNFFYFWINTYMRFE